MNDTITPAPLPKPYHIEDLWSIVPASWRIITADTFTALTNSLHLVANGDSVEVIGRLLATIGKLSAEVTELETRPIKANDPRLAKVWEQAAQLADDVGYCDEFDRMMDLLGADYSPERTVCAYVTVSYATAIPVTVHRNELKNLTRSSIRAHLDELDISDYVDLSCASIEVQNWEQA